MNIHYPTDSQPITFTIADKSLASLSGVEQRLTAVLLGIITFKPDIEPFSQTQLMAQCTHIFHEHGALAQWYGSQLVGLLGIPQIYEDDAVQCAHMAWQLQQFIAGSPFVNDYRFSLNVATLSIRAITDNTISVTGDCITQGKHLLNTTTGNGIFVTDAFRLATQHQFEFDTAVTTTPHDQPAWQLQSQKEEPQEPRGFKTVPSGFIGRQQPLEAMLHIAQNLKQGHGGIILIEGEPGIGKSRLMREFVTAVNQDPTNATIIIGKCSPQRTHYPFSLFISLLHNTFNIHPNDSNDKIRQKIQGNTKQWPQDAQEFVPYLQTLLGLTTNHPETEQISILDPNQTRQQIFVAMRRILKTLSQQNPMILLLDDIHWIDPISAELLLFLVTSITTNPILFVCAQRRQGADTPNDRLIRLQSLLAGQTEKLFLERLSTQETIALLRNLLTGAKIPHDFEQLIIAKSEGNPYFIEEFVRMFIEQKYVTHNENGWHITTPERLNESTIPLSLNALIQARVDALPVELKSTLRWAATSGLYFEQSILEDILPSSNVSQNLTRLSSRLMVSSLGNNNDRWQFMHPLLHTAVYESISTDEQKRMHKTVATILQKTWSEETPEHAESLAYHLTQAGAKEEAIPYLIKAGELANTRHAGEEALNNFQKASEFTEQIANINPNWHWRITLGIGDAYLYLDRYAESTAVLKIALQLTETNEDLNKHHSAILRRLGEITRKQGDVQTSATYYETALTTLHDPIQPEELIEATHIYIGLGWLYYTQSKMEQAEKACQITITYAKQAHHLGNLAMAENLLGGIAYATGRWEDAMRHTTRAMILREEMGYSWGVASSLGNLGILAFESGHWAKATTYFLNSLTLREELGDIEGIVITHNSLAKVYQNQDELKLAEQHHRKSLASAQLFNMPFHIANASIELAHILIGEEKYTEAEDIIENGISIAHSIAAKGLLIELACAKAQLKLAQSHWEAARQIAEFNLPEAKSLDNQIYEAIFWRIIAESAYSSGAIATSVSAITQAEALIADSTNALEKGKTSTIAYQIYTTSGNENLAQNAYLVAHDTFSQLGATRLLEKLENFTA